MVELRTRADVVRYLIERFRHKPYLLSVPQTVSAIRRLVRYARLDRCGCIVWPRNRNNDGYGRLSVWMHGESRKLYVHAVAELLSANPRALWHWQETAHNCDNPPCFHPDHVARQRRRDNRKDSARNTNRKKALKAGVRWGERELQELERRRAA